MFTNNGFNEREHGYRIVVSANAKSRIRKVMNVIDVK